MLVRAALARTRLELRQIAQFGAEYRNPKRWRLQYMAERGLELSNLRWHRTVPGAIWGVAMVRDEEDVIALTVQHLFDQGIDHVLVADNRSTDDTPRILAELAGRDARVHLATDNEPAYYQAEKMSALARRAWAAGADWVVPFDADEFWFARGESVGDFLRGLDGIVTVAHAHFHHMVPTEPHPLDLTNATFCLDATASFPGKVAMRSHPLATLSAGNHEAFRVGDRVGGLFIAHAVYRGPRQVARKIRQGAQAVELANPQSADIANHWRKARDLSDEAIDEVWGNISHGHRDNRINFKALGPMTIVRPLTWTTWDPNAEIPVVDPERPDKDAKPASLR